MKFMKLGSKPDSFQTDGDNVWYVATELATDLVINVGDVKFLLHKFPLLSKSARLQKLVALTNDENHDEISINDIPGGPATFEICAKFCYGIAVTLNAYNVAATRCAAEYLEMYESVEKGNIIYKIDVFLNLSIFRSWKDSIIVLQSTKSVLPWTEELKMVSHCLDSIATKASMDTSKVEWSYTYNRKKLPTESGNEPLWNVARIQQTVPKDWWVEDLCELNIDLYKRVILTIKTKGKVSGDVIGEALAAYAMRRLPGYNKGIVQVADAVKCRTYVETLISLLPLERNSVPCGFLLKLLNYSIVLECGETGRKELVKRIGQQFEDATVADLLVRAPVGEKAMYDVDLVQSLVQEFIKKENGFSDFSEGNEFLEIRSPEFVSDVAKVKVAKLIDGYLAEIAKDPNLVVYKFMDLAQMVSGFPRSSHDGIYRAIDMYLKEHPDVSKSERKRICRLMDCRKLSGEACTHAVQNERLPLRVVVQVLFFEQMRSTSSGNSGCTTPYLPGPIKALLPNESHGSSRSATTNTEEDWDSVPTAEELKVLRGELATLRLSNGDGKTNSAKAVDGKVKGLVMSKKIFSKLWLNKERSSENSSSENSDSPASTNGEETKSTFSRNPRHS